MPGVISIGTSTFSVVENAGALSVPLVRQNGTDGSVSITFTIIPGTATAADIAGPMTGIITFANGQATQNLIIPIVDDAVFEGGETFSILISSPTNGATTGGVTLPSVTLIENDSQPQPGSITLSAGAFAIAENAGSLTVPVLRQNGSDGAVSVTFMILAGTATTMDFGGALTGTINFAAGQTTQNLVIPLLDDAVVEGNETFTIIIVSPSGGATLGATPAATVTINENDLPPPPPPPPAAQPTGIQVVRNNRQGLTGLRVTFNNAINAADAASAFNYQFRRAGRDKRFGTRDDQRLAVRSATFDPNTKSLLITVQPLKAREQIQFTLLAANLRDANNQSVDGDRNGTPGGNFVANFRS